MAMIHLPPDFRDFLESLNSEGVEYLLVGGHAVGYYGYPRATGDMDVWVAAHVENAQAIVRVLRKFGFATDAVSVDPFLKENQLIRMGLPPVQIDLLTSISGLEFADCYLRRTTDAIDDVEVNLISLDDLKANKRATGRARDLNDLENLP